MKYYIRFNSALWPTSARTLAEAKRKADGWARKHDYAATGLCITDGNDHMIASRGCRDTEEAAALGLKDTDPIYFPRDHFYLRDWKDSTTNTNLKR